MDCYLRLDMLPSASTDTFFPLFLKLLEVDVKTLPLN